MAGSIEWAKETRRQLLDEIQGLTARAHSGSHAEALGLVPEQDHLQDLRRRLVQVERLIDAMSETEPGAETGWPGDLGDPGRTGELEPEGVQRTA